MFVLFLIIVQTHLKICTFVIIHKSNPKMQRNKCYSEWKKNWSMFYVYDCLCTVIVSKQLSKVTDSTLHEMCLNKTLNQWILAKICITSYHAYDIKVDKIDSPQRSRWCHVITERPYENTVC